MMSMPQLQYVLKGARRNLAGRPRRTRLPITPEILRLLQASWERLPSRADAVMLWAVSTLCFIAFLRMGEAVVPSDGGFDPRLHLAYRDDRVDSTLDPSWMEVVIKRSKCDQFGAGVTLSVAATGTGLCPVAAMLGHLVQRGSAPGPLFRFSDGHSLTRVRFVSCIRTALGESGMDPSLYAGHSFKVGAATTAALRGLQDSLIKTLGRWESSAYTSCIFGLPARLWLLWPDHSCRQLYDPIAMAVVVVMLLLPCVGSVSYFVAHFSVVYLVPL